ncbi:MAG TPA: UvrD-helicase domain-containing protein, partial [Rectinemataceae bacterium]|nr:UvrD-helicase domain-containing protein [Rectinemataceae bacterium]
MNELFARLDPDQRAAVELRINGTVSAGAGSGKTTVLAARYLDLLLKADSGGEVGAADLRSILCLTFTRKAAAEMRARIWRELSKDGSPRARAAAARFSEATISTIDSFCGSVLRSSAQRYGFAPDFGVDENEARRIALDEALRFLLARREDPALRELFSYQSFMTAWRDLFAEAGHRFATPVPDRRADPAATPARARAALLRIALSALDAIESARGEALELGDLGIKAGADFVAALEAFPADSREALHCAAQGRGDEGIEAIAEASRRAGALRDLGLRFGKGDGGDKDRLKEAAKAAREAARLLAACAVAAGRRGLEDRIVELLVEFAALVVEAKRRAGIMGFHDVIVATVDLLASDRRIRAWWKARYRWIMVDEFQDDDELQKDLFFLLAEGAETEGEGIPEASELAPDKLFFVGDDKQSIYRFRGADVAVFNRLGRELGGGRAREEGGTAPAMPRLRTNYRSEPRLIEFFNEVFASLLASGEAEDYEARFEKSLARKPTPGIEASVSLLLKIKGESAEEETRSDDEALAEGIARHIESLVSSEGCLVPDGEGGARRANWDDIAILLRSSSKQYLVERFLRLHDIPHGAASVRSLFVESPANDLLSLLKLALIPTDRAALATFLRSPFVRISDEGFIAVLAEATGFEAAETALDLSAKDGLRLAAARRLLAETRRRIDRMPLASLLSWLWHECGLRISILSDPAAQPFLEHFDWLFALAVAADRNGESLAAFLDRLAPLLGTPDKPEDEIEAPREARKGVHIMTVHKSKGLE